ncbi:MAG: AGE family epimerase/isomerase [Eubacteriales bacterium]|nr:AGE family epimerase/isomerase [Eubacteriales bacterium]
MDISKIKELQDFYTDELKNNILSFWLPSCEDKEFGGFLNCFDNFGKQLVSYDKYTWSQGRFIWMFAYLSQTPCPIFSSEERESFLALAKQGTEFMMKHCLISENNFKCVFLMERDGTPKQVEQGAPLDMSIYADCFAILGMAMYAFVSGAKTVYNFTKKLYDSAIERIKNNNFRTLPYPLSEQFRCHGIPMIFSNVSRELLRAAQKLNKGDVPQILKNIEHFASDILNNFVDEYNIMHEVITQDNKFFEQILGQHMNPGHTLEDVWFLFDAADLTDHKEWNEKILNIALKALENGWDEEYGGLLHYCSVTGGKPVGDYKGVENETMTKQLSGWADKLWWVHSESLYTTLLCYFRSGNANFLNWYKRIAEYTFSTFPNPDKTIGEWIQIRTQNGSPQDKVVALPVKDPFHITRNLILILELLKTQMEAV